MTKTSTAKTLGQCPNCNAKVMSRVEECPWCGAKLDLPVPATRTRQLSLGALITIMTLTALLFGLISIGRIIQPSG